MLEEQISKTVFQNSASFLSKNALRVANTTSRKEPKQRQLSRRRTSVAMITPSKKFGEVSNGSMDIVLWDG
ncbi:hypothetical protein TNCV_2105541 [Trichonephila clavipes]|nr:hypothetical protein TNCV_2105541 [Trichonephila clavipes]